MEYNFRNLKNAELFNGMHKIKFIGKMLNTGTPTYILKSHEEIHVLEINKFKEMCKIEKYVWKEDFEKFLKERSSNINKLYNIELEIYETKPHQCFASNILVIEEETELPFGDEFYVEEVFTDHENIVRDIVFLESIYDNRTLNEVIESYKDEKNNTIERMNGYLGATNYRWGSSDGR